MLQLRRKESVVVATIKRVDDEYLPTAKKAIEVDLMGCRLPFWLQLTQEECPRKLYLEEGVEESNMVAEQFTFRRTLRRKPEESESNFERQASLVAEIERKEGRAHAKAQRTRTTRTSKRAVATNESDESDVESMESDIAERERDLELREEALRRDVQQFEKATSKNTIRPGNLKRQLGALSDDEFPSKYSKSNTAKKVALLKLAENSEQNRHERNLETMRHDEHERRLQNMWIDMIEDL
jgi:hypothetical protein